MIAFVLLRSAGHLFISLRRFVFRVGPEVDPRRTVIAGAHAVAPVVLIGKATTGITNDARLELLQIIDQRLAKTVIVWNLRFFAHPDPVVNHAAEMFDKVTIDVRGNRADGFVDEDFDS